MTQNRWEGFLSLSSLTGAGTRSNLRLERRRADESDLGGSGGAERGAGGEGASAGGESGGGEGRAAPSSSARKRVRARAALRACRARSDSFTRARFAVRIGGSGTGRFHKRGDRQARSTCSVERCSGRLFERRIFAHRAD